MKHVFMCTLNFANIFAKSVFVTSSSIGSLNAKDIEILLMAAISLMTVVMLTTLMTLTITTLVGSGPLPADPETERKNKRQVQRQKR